MKSFTVRMHLETKDVIVSYLNSLSLLHKSSGSRGRRPGPPNPAKTSEKGRPLCQATRLASHRVALGQISGSAIALIY